MKGRTACCSLDLGNAGYVCDCRRFIDCSCGSRRIPVAIGRVSVGRIRVSGVIAGWRGAVSTGNDEEFLGVGAVLVVTSQGKIEVKGEVASHGVVLDGSNDPVIRAYARCFLCCMSVTAIAHNLEKMWDSSN